MCLTPLIDRHNENVVDILFAIAMVKRAIILLHDHDEPPHFNLNHDKITLKIKWDTVIRFYKTVRNLLPFPYPTNCYDYGSSSKYKSQKDCFFYYISQKELQICGFNYNWNRKYFNIIEEKLTYKTYENKCHFNINKDWLKNQCKSDCQINQYMVEHNYIMLDKINNLISASSINIEPSYHIHTTYVPKIELFGYLSTFGGLLSMWLGFNVWNALVTLFDNSEKISSSLKFLQATYIKFNKKIILNISTKIIFILTVYQIFILFKNYTFSNKQMIIIQEKELYYPKLFIKFLPTMDLDNFFQYYPEFKKIYYNESVTDDYIASLIFSMLRNNLTLYMNLNGLDKTYHGSIITYDIEYKR